MGLFDSKIKGSIVTQARLLTLDKVKALAQAGRDGGWEQGMDWTLSRDNYEWNCYYQKENLRFMMAFSTSGVCLGLLLTKGRPGNWQDIKETHTVTEGVRMLKNTSKYL